MLAVRGRGIYDSSKRYGVSMIGLTGMRTEFININHTLIEMFFSGG